MKIVVADNGVGIEKDDLKHIFERLYKCDKGRSEKEADLDFLSYISLWKNERHNNSRKHTGERNYVCFVFSSG